MIFENAKNDFHFDTRLIRRNIRDGRVERKDFEARISELPDLADKSEEIGEAIFGEEKPVLALTGECSSGDVEE